jgi:hypothetical protein
MCARGGDTGGGETQKISRLGPRLVVAVELEKKLGRTDVVVAVVVCFCGTGRGKGFT